MRDFLSLCELEPIITRFNTLVNTNSTARDRDLGPIMSLGLLKGIYMYAYSTYSVYLTSVIFLGVVQDILCDRVWGVGGTPSNNKKHPSPPSVPPTYVMLWFPPPSGAGWSVVSLSAPNSYSVPVWFSSIRRLRPTCP